jgi:hypothetical protein
MHRYRGWLKKGGNGTFFLFNGGNEFFVAAVYFFSDGRLGVRVRRLTLERFFREQNRHRLVIKRFYIGRPNGTNRVLIYQRWRVAFC